MYERRIRVFFKANYKQCLMGEFSGNLEKKNLIKCRQ